MRAFSIVSGVCICFATPTLAAPELHPGAIMVAQDATGGKSGSPQQPAQYVVPKRSTGGPSGSPQQPAQAKRSQKKAVKAKKAQ